MEYLVSIITGSNKYKSIIINAETCQEAASHAQSRYPAYKIGRISNSEEEISYFKTIKTWKN